MVEMADRSEVEGEMRDRSMQRGERRRMREEEGEMPVRVGAVSTT